MTLLEAKQSISKYREEYPEKIVLLGTDFEFTNERLEDVVYITNQYYLSENISEEIALEKAMKFFIRKATENELTRN